MSSPNIEAAACLQIRDAGDTVSVSVTTSVGTEDLPQVMRGRYVRMYNKGTDLLYLSGGNGATDPSAANGFEIAGGEFQDVFIPGGEGTFPLKHLGAAALTLKIVLTSG